MKTSVIVFFGLLATIALAIAVIVNNPQAQAEAEQIRLQAQRTDQAQAIQQKYAEARAEVMAQGLAQLELQRALDDQAVKQQGELNQLAADYQRQVADLQASMGERWGLMIFWLILDIGLAVSLVRISGGLARKVGQWAQEIKPNAAGQYSMYLTSAGILAPGRLPGSYLLLQQPGRLERLMQQVMKWIVFIMALKRGQPTDLPDDSAWVQMPDVTAASLQVTTQDQAIGLITAATRHGQAPQSQTQASFETARQAFAQGMAQRMPTTFRHIDDPREVAAFTQLLAEQIDA
jgi:hypothetical protein